MHSAIAHVDFSPPKKCQPASVVQKRQVLAGLALLKQFLIECKNATGNESWCEELTRPSEEGRPYFECSYGKDVKYRLVHPDRKTWKDAFRAINLIQKLKDEDIRACGIYYWWRPEPFNRNAGGAPTRHPYGTSVDVRFCSMKDMEKAHLRLCSWRKQGFLKALGYYNSPELHLGISDTKANTWGKDCP